RRLSGFSWFYIWTFLKVFTVLLMDCTYCDRSIKVDPTTIHLLCTRNTLKQKTFVLKHPSDPQMFIVCTDIMVGCVGKCGNNKRFDGASRSCNVISDEHCKPPASAEQTTQALNIPTKCPSNSKTCTYLPFPGDRKSFIICDKSYPPVKGKCLLDTVFNETLQACINDRAIVCKNNVKHCKRKDPKKNYPAREFYFGCIEDPVKFIQCDMGGREFLMSCKYGTVWCNDPLACCIPGNLPTNK
ncbi:uncharacterized protein LOC115230802, partial, partial [Argonauta hians]